MLFNLSMFDDQNAQYVKQTTVLTRRCRRIEEFEESKRKD